MGMRRGVFTAKAAMGREGCLGDFGAVKSPKPVRSHFVCWGVDFVGRVASRKGWCGLQGTMWRARCRDRSDHTALKTRTLFI
jgi:hypothetical protein